MDDLRPVFLGLPDPLEGHRVVFGDVAAFHEEHLGVLEVDPVVGHRAPTECGPQTGDRGLCHKPRLVLQGSSCRRRRADFVPEVALLVRALGAAEERDRVAAADRECVAAVLLRRDPVRVAGGLDPARELVERVVPGDVGPAVGAGRAVLRRLSRAGANRASPASRCPSRTNAPVVHDVARVAFEVDELALDDVAHHPATARAEVAGGGELLRAGELEVRGARRFLRRQEKSPRKASELPAPAMPWRSPVVCGASPGCR